MIAEVDNLAAVQKTRGLDQVLGVMVQITPGLSGEEYVQLQEGISR